MRLVVACKQFSDRVFPDSRNQAKSALMKNALVSPESHCPKLVGVAPIFRPQSFPKLVGVAPIFSPFRPRVQTSSRCGKGSPRPVCRQARPLGGLSAQGKAKFRGSDNTSQKHERVVFPVKTHSLELRAYTRYYLPGFPSVDLLVARFDTITLIAEVPNIRRD